uniref:Alternative para-aminobenzoate biosynthesis enzyme CT610 n=1 Tax=uncultured Armatimonadetes bacterium TaxID=157466 RepID=A0A6J4JCY9_9BACT|nr:Alternative para-aminobenzoate biosynthesis enzyme CT610 [uncultured Armatimonadetes bacterium]
MDNTIYLDDIDARIAARHLLTHPFYQAWTRGELSRPALQDYARQYYQHVAAFPTYLSAVHAGTEDAATRRQILANLIDEEAGDPNHPELWLRFAESLGVGAEDARNASPWPETRGLIETFRALCRGGSTAEGLAALYAYESQIPAVSESKIDGLRAFYGMADDDEGYRYFSVHIEADREHAAAERALLAQYVDARNASAVAEAAERTLDALWELLSGVCRRHAIAC